MEYCNAVQITLVETTSRTKLEYMDDTNLERRISTIAKNVQHITDSFPSTGLILNLLKYEIIANNFDQISGFQGFQKSSLLEAAIFEGKAVDKALNTKITNFGMICGTPVTAS